MRNHVGELPDHANDNVRETELERAIRECPGPGSSDPWWQRRRHLVMMDYGRRTDPQEVPLWPQAAEYVRHQETFDRIMAECGI